MATAQVWHSKHRGRRAASAVVLAGVAAGSIAVAPALPGTSAVSGRLTSEAMTGPECTSPVEICTQGTLKGALKGTFAFTATAVVATADSPSTGVLLYTGDLVITTKGGTLSCKDAGALSNRSDRAVVGLCSVVVGTGEFAGATGQLRTTGTFPETSADGATGTAAYEGVVEVP